MVIYTAILRDTTKAPAAGPSGPGFTDAFKVLAEVLPTCPQYRGHCTRMDLVGNPTATIGKHKFGMSRDDRLAAMIGYLKATPGVRDVVVSGGDVANLPWPRLEAFVAGLLPESGQRWWRARDRGAAAAGLTRAPGA